MSAGRAQGDLAGSEALFEQLVVRFGSDPRVAPPSPGGKFGASGLKVGGKLFAMLWKDRLVVKLPRQRVDELIGSGEGERFDPGHGRLMKEWVTIGPEDSDLWAPLAEEALGFVS